MIMFVISGIQYWVTYYFIQIFHVPQKQAASYFGVAAVSSPILGCILSGIISTNCGGYTSKRALPICVFVGMFAVASAIIFPYVNNIEYAIGLLWMVLFCGSFVMPILVGVMLTKIEPEQRA